MDKLPGFPMNLDNFLNFSQGQGNRTEVVSFTEVVEEKAFLTWEIDGISDATKWEAIKSQAKCFLQLGKNMTQPQHLCFYLREDETGLPGLYCRTLNGYQHDVVLRVKIEKLNSDGSSTVILNAAVRTLKKDAHGTAFCCILSGSQAYILFPGRSPGSAVRFVWQDTTADLIKLPQPKAVEEVPDSGRTPPNAVVRQYYDASPPRPPTKVLGEQDFIQIGISVSMFSCKSSQETQPAALKLAEESLTKDLGSLYNDGNGKAFFPDLELESKDGYKLKTHKFILAARSPALKTRLEELEKETGNENVAVLKMPELNAQPLRAILHWMYKGELSPSGSLVMGDVIKGARTLQLTPLMRICDKKLISLCNTKNMFELYQVAKDNAFPNAMKDISQFIKTNI